MASMGNWSFLECSLGQKWMQNTLITRLDLSHILSIGFDMWSTVSEDSPASQLFPTDEILENPHWDASSCTRLDAKVAGDQNPFNNQTWDGNHLAFKDKGGKVLTYQGQADCINTSENSPRYYNHVSATMSLPSNLDDFYRFFRISGMGHCGGGVGAHMIGQTGIETTTLDPQHNVLMWMVDWVENGNAPETVTGTKYVNDDPSQGVPFVRNHCKYPARNDYMGPENYTSPDAWQCITDSF